MSKSKARELMDGLEESGLEDRDVVLHTHHAVLMELVGGESKLEAPSRPKRKEPRKSPHDPDARPAPTGPRPNDTRVARDERLGRGDAEPGAKDARLAEDSRIDDARNSVNEDEAPEKEADTRRKIKADKKLARAHGVEEGEPHPDDKGMDGAVTDEPEPVTVRRKKAKKAR